MNNQKTKLAIKATLRPYLLLITLVSFSFALLLTSGCATQAPVAVVKKEAPELVWPNPPQKAIIKYIGSVSKVKETETKEKPRFMDILAGADEDTKRVQFLSKPWGVSGDPQGRLFVADTALGGLFVFNRETGKAEQWGKNGMGKLVRPIEVTSDKSGHIYVSDVDVKRVVVFDSEGRYVNAFGGEDIFENPVGIAVNDELGRIYVVDSKKHRINVFDMQGKLLFTFGNLGGDPGNFYFPTSIAIGTEGRLFVTDTMNFRIQILDADGGYIKSFGNLGDQSGNLSRPKGLALDADGHVYVVDGAFSNIQVFNEDGQLLLILGEGGTNPGQFQLPTGISIDQQGFIYVADQLNHRVQIFQYLGAPPTESEPEVAPTSPKT